MELTQLQAFVAISQYGSFSEASEQLHLTQPAITKRIQALESDLDAILFDRVGRSIKLTEAGETLLPQARKLLQQMEDCRRAIRELHGKVAGTLHIGTSHHVGLHRLPPYLKHYRRQYPEVALDFKFLDSEQAYQAVLAGDIELAIVTLPQIAHDSLQTQAIWQDELCVVVGEEHPLSQYGGQILKPNQLLAYQAILPNENTFTYQIISKVLQTEHNKIQTTMTTNNLETIRMLVSIGLGWSVLPKGMLDEQMIALKIPYQLTRTLGLVHHRNRSLSNAAQAMMNCLQLVV